MDVGVAMVVIRLAAEEMEDVVDRILKTHVKTGGRGTSTAQDTVVVGRMFTLLELRRSRLND